MPTIFQRANERREREAGLMDPKPGLSTAPTPVGERTPPPGSAEERAVKRAEEKLKKRTPPETRYPQMR